MRNIDYAILYLTTECNLSCEYCDTKKGEKTEQSTILQNLENLLKYCTIKKAVLSGGEVGLLGKKFIEEISGLLKKNGTEYVHINSNGYTSDLNPKHIDGYTIHLISHKHVPKAPIKNTKYDYVITSKNINDVLNASKEKNNFIDKISKAGNKLSFKKYNNKVDTSFGVKDNEFRKVLNTNNYKGISNHRDYEMYNFLENNTDLNEHRINCYNNRGLLGFDLSTNNILHCTISYVKSQKISITERNINNIESIFETNDTLQDMCIGCHIKIFEDIRYKRFSNFIFKTEKVQKIFEKMDDV